MRRWLGGIAALAATLAAAYVAYYCYTRLTTPPKVIPGTPRPRVNIPNDVSAELSAACDALLQADRSLTQSELSEALNGEWIPQARPYLHRVIKFLSLPEVATAMQRIDIQARGNWNCRVNDTEWGSTCWTVSVLFATRARLRAEQSNDISGAWDDLATLLALTDTRYGASVLSTYSAIGREGLAWREFTHLAREHPVPECVANAALAALARRVPTEQRWHEVIHHMDVEANECVDQTYTCDANGDGWLVLGGFVVPGSWSIFDDAQIADRGAAWNLGSFLFRTRREVAQRIARVRSEYDATSIFDIGAVERASLRSLAPCDVLNGPLTLRLGIPDLYLGGVHRALLQCECDRRAARLAIALNQYRAAHGDWPMALDALVREYLDRIPGAILCEHPMHYDYSPDGFTLRPCRDWDGNAFPNADNSWRSLTFAGEREACNDPWTP